MEVLKGLRSGHVIATIVTAKVLSLVLTQTWYVPDEYWQSLEVAHKQVFGYGALTWEWEKGIRSYLYPGAISLLYSILQLTGLDNPITLTILPRLFQAFLSAYADYSFYQWTGKRKWALFLILCSWFWFYTSSRTLIQTVETCLVVIALSKFPFKDGRLSYYEKENNSWLWLAFICVFLRPTSAPLWTVFMIYNLLTTNQGKLRLLISAYVPFGLLVSGSLVALDSYLYSRLIITPWEFFRFNILHDIASFYGQHPWHWYLWQGIPAILGLNVVPSLIGAVAVLRSPKENRTGLVLLIAISVHIAVYSFIPHKEFRFVLPLLPLFIFLAQQVIVPWSRKAKKWQLYGLFLAVIASNAAPAAYFGLVHQAGTTTVMPLVANALRQGNLNESSVLFLMPCHSTPLYSHLHVNVSARYLTCEPPLERAVGTHESEAFFNNPQWWWKSEYLNRATPTVLVMFDILRGRVETQLKGYKLLHEIPHTQFPEGEVGKNLLVYQKIRSQSKPPADAAV